MQRLRGAMDLVLKLCSQQVLLTSIYSAGCNTTADRLHDRNSMPWTHHNHVYWFAPLVDASTGAAHYGISATARAKAC